MTENSNFLFWRDSFQITAREWRYKIVAHFETQTFQPDKALIKCYFVQIQHFLRNVL